VNQTVRQTLVTMAVPRAAVSNAVALNSVGFNINKVLGPTLGGFLIAWFGAAGNFFVQSAAYLGVLISIGLMQVPAADQTAKQESVWSNLMDGFRYVRSTPAVFALLIAAFVPSVIAMPYLTLMPVIQKDVLHVGPDALGLMLAAPGVGAVIFTLGLATFSSRVKRKGLILLASMAGLGCCLVLFSQTTTLPMALLALVGIGGAQILYNAVNMTMLQLLVPEGLMGRVMSIYLINVGFSPAGALFAGVSTSVIGAPTTIAIMGSTVVVLAILMFFRNPELRRIET
jgi:predicted MFS family arabinose efflux permease